MTSKTDPRAFRAGANELYVSDEQPDPRDAQIAALQAQLAAAQAMTAKQVVYEPETPNGKRAKEASAFAHLTVDQLIAKIDAGEAVEPRTSCLCADGWYAARRTS